MLSLYPKIQRRFVLLSSVFVVSLLALLWFNPAANRPIWILLAVLGLAALFISSSNHAVKAHQKELQQLYEALDAEGFLRGYRQHLQQKLPFKDTELMVRMHLSNAYIALGRFEEAKEVLKAYRDKPGKKEEATLLTQFAITDHLCYCARQEEVIAEATVFLHALMDQRARLEELQEGKKAGQRLRFHTRMHEVCVQILSEGKGDVDWLKAETSDPHTQMLSKVTLSYWIARAYWADNQRKEAERMFRWVIDHAPHLHPGRKSAEWLASLQAERSSTR